MKRIISFGDSFTAALGTDRAEEDKIFKDTSDIMEARRAANKFRAENSFTKFLADKFEVPYIVNGDIGCNNKAILNNIMAFDKDTHFEKDDLVLIGFTSSVRDKLPFWPDIINDNVRAGLSWSLLEMARKKNLLWFESTLAEGYQDKLNEFLREYIKFYVSDIFDEAYIEIYNRNLISFIQEYLKYLKVDYILFDAFEIMTKDVPEFIDTQNYWGCGKETIYSFLLELDSEALFEIGARPSATCKHPSRIGHQLFADELYRYINEIF